MKENETNKVIVRTERAGVFFGQITKQENTPAGVLATIKDCRRIWFWDGAASLSELAVSGTKAPSKCKFPPAVKSMTVCGVIEIIPCTKEAVKSIEGVPVWRA